MARPEHAKGTTSFAGFARILGKSRSYVTQLKAEGRLALTDDGKRVRIAESHALIRDTADPARAGVAERHAAARTAKGAGGADAPVQAPPEADDGDGEDAIADPIERNDARRKAKAIADKAEADARKALRDEQLELGQLLSVDDVEHALRDAGARLRNTLENLPNTLAPELAAATDEGRVRVLLGEAIEHALEEASRKFGAIAKESES